MSVPLPPCSQYFVQNWTNPVFKFLFEHCVFHPYSFLWLLTGLAAVCQCVHFVLGNPNQDRASNAVSQVLNRELLDLSTFLQQLYLHCVSVKELSAVKICFCKLAFVHLWKSISSPFSSRSKVGDVSFHFFLNDLFSFLTALAAELDFPETERHFPNFCHWLFQPLEPSPAFSVSSPVSHYKIQQGNKELRKVLQKSSVWLEIYFYEMP